MRRPTAKSAAVATFIGGFAAAGITVAAASTPDDQGTDPTAPTSPASSTHDASRTAPAPSSTSRAGRGDNRGPERPGRHRGPGRATSTSTPPSSVRLSTRENEPGDDRGARESEPGDDHGVRENEPGDDHGVRENEPGDEKRGDDSAHHGDGSGSRRSERDGHRGHGSDG